ncbi:MAG TPA: nucleoside triphosphate pyrophosphatase [Sphingomicrobium sp.]|nr:nucleoside triphosphate pyrophosphatase [Sphingomicrobium sp.]
MPLILASSSLIRRDMLRSAGIEFEIVPSSVDESAAKARVSAASDIAVELAAAKAIAISVIRPDDWIIGSDSVVSVAGRTFDKPRNRGEAAEHLRFFSGKPMILTSAVALARGQELDWRYVATATLYVRPLSEAFIAAYLDAEWPEVGHTVGVFRLEARGVQLFSSIEGDHFTILGMPLIPLLGALRDRGLLVA